MQPDNLKKPQEENQTSATVSDASKPKDENVALAHEQAEVDMIEDAELNNAPDPAADLDEGELARLDNDNDNNPLI